MFLGHFAAGFAAKKLTPYTSLGTLLLAFQLLDLLWPTFLLLGYEEVAVAPGATPVAPLDFVSYPWTHSLAMAAVWAVLLTGGYLFFRRYPRGAWVVAGGVVSHWVLDLVAHRPDLPLVPGAGPKVGLGLWYSLPATLAVEATMFAIGLWLYARNTEPTDGAGRWGLAIFALLLVGIYAASVFGPPPPDAASVAWVGQAQWLLVLGGYWIDRHRVAIRQW